MTAAIACRGVEKRFEGVNALVGVDLDLEQGGILGLIGPNGSGKTTLLNCISGVLHPTAGRIEVDGADASALPSDRVARLGVSRTFQEVRLFLNLTVRENVEVGLASAAAWGRRRGGRAAGARALLDEFDIGHVEHRYPATLPYGVQRRVEMARAMATDPVFVLLDEPAAGMNEEESDLLLALVHDLRERRGCGVLIIDHDLRLIMRLCDAIHVLHDGATIAVGTPAEVQQDEQVRQAYLGPGSEVHSEQ